MRAVVVPEYGDASVLRVAERVAPSPGPTEVAVDVRACGVNFADIEQRRGRYRDGPDPPFVPGLEGAGVVAETGRDVEDWTVGDEVACLFPEGGGYAERAVTDESYLFPKPADLSVTEAGGLLVRSFTAHNALFEWGGLTGEETVLITAAAGGVGSTAVAFAAEAGARVVGAASTPRKRDFARAHGADHAVDYTDESLPAAVRDVTDGVGPDLVLDGVGGVALTDGLEALRPGGRLVTYGVASGRVPTIAAPRLFYRNASVLGYHLLNGLAELRERVLAAESRIVDLVESGAVPVAVEGAYPLSAAGQVHEAIEGRETVGRLVLLPGE